MKILYLCPDLGIPLLGVKGSSVHVRELVAAFGRAGHSVVVVGPLLNKSPWERPEQIDARLLQIPPGPEAEAAFLALKSFNQTLGVDNVLPGELRRVLYDADLSRQLNRRFENNPPDFIYERASLYTTAGVSAARELGRPLIVEINAPVAMEQSVYRGAGLGELAVQAERWTLLRADAVIAVSSTLRDHVVSLGVPPERVRVIPNGVNAAIFSPGAPDPELKARLNPRGGPLLGFVGSLRPWHGVEVLPSLLDNLAVRHPDVQMVIVGDGPLRARLEEDLAARRLAQRAVFTGAMPHSEVAALIRQCDVALAPYPQLDHGFYFSPLKLFEYMACGVAVVAANVGQIAEVVRDGETGLLYPPGDEEALTTACERLLGDPALRQSLGRAASREIHGRYTWDRNAQRVVDLALELIEMRKGG